MDLEPIHKPARKCFNLSLTSDGTPSEKEKEKNRPGAFRIEFILILSFSSTKQNPSPSNHLNYTKS